MLVLHDGELLHIDSTADVLEHYGVKGMKWGKRMAGYAKSFGKAYYNLYRHPILSANAVMSADSKSHMGRFMGTKRALDYQNNFVKTQNDANINYKKKLKDLKKNKYKKADVLNKGLNKKLKKSYVDLKNKEKNFTKNTKLTDLLTKDGRSKRAIYKKEYIDAAARTGSIIDQKVKNRSDARKQYKLDKKKLKDDRKNATTGLRY